MSNATRAPSTRTKLPGMGRIFRRGQIFWIAYYRHGTEYRESTHSTDENQAVKLLKKRFGEITSRRFVGPQEERVMFEDLAKGIERDYKVRGLRSTRAAAGRMLHLKKAFGSMRALDISPDRIRTYQADRLDEKASPATINRETSHLARAFRIAVKSGLLSVVPPFPDRLEESAPRQGFFEHAEYLGVREHLSPAVYQDVLDFAYYSGWRRGEVVGLTWREVDTAGSVIRLDPDRSKTKTGRLLPISQPLREVLQRRLAARRLDCLLVFHRDGEPVVDWRKAWEAACTAAGFPGKRLHDCRRTTARNLIRSGTPERVAMQLTGHKRRSVFDRYNIVSESDLRAGVDRLASYVKRLPTEANIERLKKAADGRRKE
jgi:integrase